MRYPTITSCPSLLAALLLVLPIAHPAKAREVQSLDGTWQIVFDTANAGRAAGWNHHQVFFKLDGRRDIEVPSCWELTEKDYEGVAYYQRTFRVPPNWEGQIVRLHFDAVNFRAELWVNDTAVGVHEGGFTPFEFRVDDLLKWDGSNTVILRVVGPILLQDKHVDSMGPMETPQWRGAITGGIWQSVRLIATGEAYVQHVFIEPRLSDNTATFHLKLNQAGHQSIPAEVEVAVHAAEAVDPAVRSLEHITLEPGENAHTVTLKIPDVKTWSPDQPHLYRAVVNVSAGDTESDQWTTRFGMREFTIRNKQFYLNGRPMYLKATFFEGLYPEKLAAPDSRDMMIREIQLARQAGFNMIRPWRKPPPPEWLDLADELGVLTVGSLAVECMDYPIESAHLPRWVENELRESILRDRNRACVVQWELFNELKRPVLMRMLHPMAVLARQLDPTRLILDESGGWAQGANLFLPYATQPTKFNDIHDYPGQQINDEVYTKLLLAGSITHEEMRKQGLKGRLPGRNVVPGRMTFFSELGYGSLPDLVDNNQRFTRSASPIAPPTIYHRRLADQHRQVLKDSGFNRIYPDLRTFCLDQQQLHGTANRRMIEAVRCNPHVQGYCIHALTAGDWIMGAGLLDLYRQPKTYAYEGTQAANQAQILSIRVRPRNVYADQGTRIEVTGVNELDAFQGRLKIDVTTKDGRSVFTRTIPADNGAGITSLFSEALDTSTLSGTFTVHAALSKADGSPVTVNTHSFDIFSARQLAVPAAQVAVLDPHRAFSRFLKSRGIPFETFTPETDRTIPVFVSRTVANTPAERALFYQLTDWIKDGGIAVYLQGGGPRVPWGKPGPASPLLPVKARLKRTMGHWMCMPRLVNAHPVFDGLPVDTMMGSVYENVWPQSTLFDLEGELIAGTIGFDWFPDFDLGKRHYYGPGDAYWGSDVAWIPVEQGHALVSQLRLVEQLGKDPVADRILLNMISWTASQADR